MSHLGIIFDFSSQFFATEVRAVIKIRISTKRKIVQ
jgi:hypothetical protein